MEETREAKLTELREKKLKAETLTLIDNELGKLEKELENEALVK